MIWKRLLLFLSLSLLSLSFLTNNAHAFEVSVQANWVATEQVQFVSGSTIPSFNYPTRSVCGNENGAYINSLFIQLPAWTYDTTEYLEYTMLFNNYKFDNGLDAYLSLSLNPTLTNSMRIIDYKFENLGNSQAKATFIIKITGNIPQSVLTLGITNSSTNNAFVLSTYECIASGFVSLYSVPVANQNATNADIISAIQSASNVNRGQLDNVLNYLGQMNQNLSNQNNQLGDKIDNINNDQKTETQDASDNSQTTADSSSEGAEQASQSLLSAFTGFVGAVVSASPTNCTINGNLGKMDLGLLNFCKDSPPAVVQTIGSLIAIALIVPLSYYTAKRLLNTIRSFQT